MSDGFPDRGVFCPGCHDSDFADFDHYVEVNGIAPDEVPAAFGAWLHLSSGGAWDGDVERVADEQPE